jgi:hypothetical protein
MNFLSFIIIQKIYNKTGYIRSKKKPGHPDRAKPKFWGSSEIRNSNNPINDAKLNQKVSDTFYRIRASTFSLPLETTLPESEVMGLADCRIAFLACCQVAFGFADK